MSRSVVAQMILKDWSLHRQQIWVCLAGGTIALAIFQWGGEPAAVVGSVWFFIALIMAGTMLPLAGIVNERKNQNLAFVMSLPISILQYTISKMLSTLGMFLIPWVTLVTAAVLLIETRSVVPRGSIPIMLILAMLPVVGYALMTGAALVGESEGWGIAANVFCSSSYGLVWYFLTRIPELMADMKATQPVWNAAVLKTLGIEFALTALILGLTFYLQSRKRDFI